jgi:hypothetical protein
MQATLSLALSPQNIIQIGAVSGFASGPAFGPVRRELWQILTFWFFCIKAKEQERELGEDKLKARIRTSVPR